MSLLVIVPTYNEIENIKKFINALFAYVPSDAAVLVVDDNSPDGTAQMIEQTLVEDYPGRLHLLVRPEKQGGATAFLEGFSWGINNGYDILLAMDADFSHNPQYIPLMLAAIGDTDMVIGSRNIKGGMIENRSWIRDIITKCAAFYCRIVLGCPIRDFTGGYNMYKKEVFEKIGINTIQCRGYSFQIEIKYKAFRAGLRLMEIPIIFPDRKYGKSKMSTKFLFEALLDVWKIRRSGRDDRGIDQFLKFCITGGLGTITNLALFFLCVDMLGLHEIPVSIACFTGTAVQNYLINHFWSFKKTTAHTPPSLKKWVLFTGTALAGLACNLAVMKSILAFYPPPYKVIAQGAGIAAGMLVNFIVAKYIVFRSGGKAP